MSGEPILKVDDVTVAFPNRRGEILTVRNVSFEVYPGEILGFVGESGAGKSMTGAAIMGLIEPPGRIINGTVTYKGQVLDAGDASIRGKHIGMVFQDPLTSLNPLRTVEDQLVETISTHLNVSQSEALERAKDGLVEVGIDSARLKSYPHEFSGGMRQRVVIALALAAEPDLIIADEPTTALDVSIQAQILDLLKAVCKKRGASVILITHDMGVIAETADRVAVMYDGRLVEVGDTQQIVSKPKHSYTKGLMAATPTIADASPDKDLFQIGKKPPASSARKKTKQTAKKLAGTGDVFLQANNLAKQFDVSEPWLVRLLQGLDRNILQVVDDVSFSIRRGETYALVGESGSGKTTIARMIVGLLRPTDGTVTIDGLDLHDPALSQEDRLALRRRIQMVFQSPYASLNPRWRVGSILAEPMKAFGLVADKKSRQDMAVELLEQVGLTADDLRKFPHEFSGGQRQRISIARALASKPDFIVCDEPTSALDVSVQAQVLNLLKQLQRDLGLTYLFISHDLAVVKSMAQTVGVLQYGKLVEEQPSEKLFAKPQHDYTKMLLDAAPRLEKAFV